MEEIEVGDYVRTKDGIIGKVTDVDNMFIYADKTLSYGVQGVEIIENDYILKKEVTKHSKQLIDLIEVGDFVNGELIHKIDKGSNYCYLYYDNCKTFVDYQIKTILTKEKYMANCYKVGGEDGI